MRPPVQSSGKLPIALQLVLLTAAMAFTKLALDVIQFLRGAVASWDDLSTYIADGTLALWGTFSRPAFALALCMFAVIAFLRILSASRPKAYAISFWFLVAALVFFLWRLFAWYDGGAGPWRLEQLSTRLVAIFVATRALGFLWLVALLAAVWPHYVSRRGARVPEAT